MYAIRSYYANRLALDLGVPSGRITDILNGRRAISADTAVRLGRYFGNSAQFWLDLQGQYEIALIERLEQSADVLSSGQKRSLSDALAASWDAAPPEERAALSALRNNFV